MKSKNFKWHNVQIRDPYYDKVKWFAEQNDVTFGKAFSLAVDKYADLESKYLKLKDDYDKLTREFIKKDKECALLTGRMMNVPTAKERDEIDFNYRMGEAQEEQQQQITIDNRVKPEYVRNKFIERMSEIALDYRDELVSKGLSESEMTLFSKDNVAYFRAIQDYMGRVFDKYSAMDEDFSMDNFRLLPKDSNKQMSKFITPPITNATPAKFICKWLEAEAGEPLNVTGYFVLEGLEDAELTTTDFTSAS